MAGTGLAKLGTAARLQSSQNHQPEFNISNGYTNKRTVESCKVEETRRDGEERRKFLFFSLLLFLLIFFPAVSLFLAAPDRGRKLAACSPRARSDVRYKGYKRKETGRSPSNSVLTIDKILLMK